MKISDFHIRNHDKLDEILVGLCQVAIRRYGSDPNQYGAVASAVLDNNNRLVVAGSYKVDGKWVHAERAAIDKYTQQFGPVPEGSIIITTCSPCTDPMPDRVGSSCEDLISSTAVHKVYAGFRDPSQHTRDHDKTYHLQITRNKKIQELCGLFANTWLKKDLNELSFLGSTCTKDCSGHRAGYAWSQSKGGQVAQSPFSPSFNKGSQLYVDGK
jgi:pyrimidine deaminase RibD-like protein